MCLLVGVSNRWVHTSLPQVGAFSTRGVRGQNALVQSSYNTTARGTVLGFIEPDLIEPPTMSVNRRLRVVALVDERDTPNAASYAAARADHVIRRCPGVYRAPSGRDRAQVAGRPAVNALCPDATQDQPTCLLRYISLKF
jgi:hypothetical protein